MNPPVSYSGDEPYIYFSFSPEDRHSVFSITAALQHGGFRIRLRDDSCNNRDTILACGYFIAFISGSYIRSAIAKEELLFARDAGKQQLLIYLEDADLPSGMAMRIGRNQAIFYNRYRDKAQFYAKLYEAQNIADFCDSGALPAVTEEKHTATTLQRRRSASALGSIILLLLVLGVAALVLFLNRQPPAVDPSDTSGTAETAASATVPLNILLDNEFLTVQDAGLIVNNSDAALTFSAENKTGSEMYLSLSSCYINGISCDTEWMVYIPASQTGMVEIPLAANTLSSIGITPDEIRSIDCTLTQKSQNTSAGQELGRFLYYPLGGENEVQTTYTPAEDETVLVRTENYIIAAGTGMYSDTDGSWTVPLILVNLSDQDMTFTLGSEQINGFAQTSGWGQAVYAQRILRTQVRFTSVQWQPSGYEKVLSFTGDFSAHIGSTTNSEPVSSQSFTLYPEGEQAAQRLHTRPMTKKELLFENEDFRFGYLGSWQDDAFNNLLLFYVHNLTGERQSLTFRLMPEDQETALYSQDLTLEPDGQMLITYRRSAEGLSAQNAVATLEWWNPQYFRYETFGPYDIPLETTE